MHLQALLLAVPSPPDVANEFFKTFSVHTPMRAGLTWLRLAVSGHFANVRSKLV